MSYPVLWWKTPSFYPIGNTPPACLTQDLAPEQNAQILLLGCGDPRNILHTIHAGLDNRMLDFTCCDLETAVLARNMLLLTMIADGISWHYTWRIFYHFYLDSDTLHILLSQCRALTQASTDLATWNASIYGKYLRFCTKRSMLEIRSHWEHYLSVDGLPEPQKRALRKSFTSSMKEVLQNHADSPMGVVTTFRASGPLIFTAYNAQIDSFRSFWSTGVMKGPFPHPPASHVNPMFAYSLGGQEFNVNYATQPLSAFHLAPALAQSQRSTHPISAEDLVDAVTTQFSNWCKSFHMQTNTVKPSVTIRFFAGDCLFFCKALRKFQTTKLTKTGIYARPWGLSQIDFTTDYSERGPPAPSIFNIIDTSNLADHIGLLNILLVTVPLLQQKPWSVLHTNTLQDPTESVATTLSDKLFADIPTLSLFLGVAPVSHLSDFSTHSSKDSLRSLSWKYPSSVIANKSIPYPELDEDSRVLVCDELLLGQFLYSVYTQMFAEEDIRGHARNPTPASFRRQNIVQYVRASFVEFLSTVHGRVCVDWAKAFACFLRLADSDKKLFYGHRQSYQDLTCQLYLTDLASHNDLRWSFLRDIRSQGDPFEGWDRVPPVVSVTLKVPRERLKVMEDIDQAKLALPILFCMTAGLRGENMHSSIRPTFGDVVITGHHQDAQVVIREDQAGWQGISSLIVSFDAPSWIFTKAAGMERIALNARSTPHNARLLAQKLGNMELRIFTTLVTDNKHVWITRFRPNESQAISRLDSDDSPDLMNARRNGIINVDFHASTRANSLTLRHTIEDQGMATTLANGVPVSAKAITDTLVQVSFQGYEKLFKFPFPISGDRITTRIARKSSYIEVVAPIRRDPETSVGLFLNPFPITRTTTSFNLLNVHYINLSKMPTLDLSVSKEKLEWLSLHLDLSFSEQERNSSATDEDHRVRIDLKESISTIFLGSSGLEKKSTVFELSNPTIGVYAVIFVNALKLDLSESQTVVADACVIPLNEKNSPKVIATLRRGSQHGVTIIYTSVNVMEAWKALLPTVAERCRTWQHSDRCEYRKRGIPACNEGALDKRASPLCQCGLGKDLGTFASLAAWQEIQSEATRVAIAPLFPFSLPGLSAENVDKAMKLLGRAGTATQAACGHCSGPGQPTLLVCSRCKRMAYCSQKCQKAHWRIHKSECIS